MVAIRHSHELNPANFELASWSASLEMSPITFEQLQSAMRKKNLISNSMI